MLKKLCSSAFLLVIVQVANACPFCNPQIRNAIYDGRFLPNVITILSAFVALGIVVAVLAVLAARRYKGQLANDPQRTALNPVPLLTTATILGIGIGGFIDGIFLHQTFQWHEMLSARIPPTNYVNKSVNMFWDGIFHTGTLVITFIGIVRLWKLLPQTNINRSGYLFSGGLIGGWGIFNFIEGIIDHQLLKLHNVKEVSDTPEAWNVGFLIVAVLLMIAGYLLAKKATPSGKLRPLS